jgi:DNA-binding HxlR family transcriptional regulator
MKGKRTNLADSPCAIARALHAIGDWWSLLIIRDALGGSRRFGEFQKSLGLAKNILSTRLRKLVAEGIMELAPASDGTAYKEYVLTEKGQSLYVVVVALWQWGETFSFAPDKRKKAKVDKKNRRVRAAPLELRAEDGRVLGPRDFTAVTGVRVQQI